MNAADHYVTPGRRYLTLLGGYHIRGMDHAERANFGRAIADDARRVTNDELDELFSSEWRSQLTAGWLVGLTRRDHYRDRVGELLLASQLVYAGQGFCFALARFGAPQDAQLLVDYLDRYLPQLDRHYQQDWAMGALLHVDTRLGTKHSGQLLQAWQRWAAVRLPDRADPEDQREHIDVLCSYADEWMR